MNQPSEIFMYEGFQVRTVMKNGDPWFVLKDLCDVLEIGHAPALKQRLSDDVVLTHPIQDSLGRMQDSTIVNEDGMYDVIFESRKLEAKEFRKWVTGNVLPSIRKTGSYVNSTYAIEDGIIHAMQGIKQLKEDNAQLKLQQVQQSQELTSLKLVVDNEIWLTDHQKADIQDRVKNRCGVLQHMGYQSSFQGVYSALKTHFNVPKYDKIPRKDYEKALDFIRGWYPKKQAR